MALTAGAALFLVMGGLPGSGLKQLEAEQAELKKRRDALPEIPTPEQEMAVGMHVGDRVSPGVARWIQVDLGEVRKLDSVVLMPAYAASKWGYGFPVRYRVESSAEEDFRESQTLLDRGGWDHPIPRGPVFIEAPGVLCRYVRVTATALARHPLNVARSLFCLGEIFVFGEGRNLALRARVTAPGSAESLPTWSLRHVVDGSTAFGAPMRMDASRAGNGWHSAVSAVRETRKWVQVDLGGVFKIDEVRLVPARPSDFLDRAGFGFPERFCVEIAQTADFETRDVVFDTSEGDFLNPGGNVVGFPVEGREARFVRVVASRLWQRHRDFVFALAELEVISGGRNMALGRLVECLDETSTGTWKREFLVDGRGSAGALVDAQLWYRQLAERAEVEERLERLGQSAEEARREADARGRVLMWGVLGVVVVLGTGAVLKVRAVRRREEHRLREQIARDLHDEIGSSLGSIVLMSERAARKGDAAAIAEIGRLATEASASMRGILWMVRGSESLTLGELREALRGTAVQMLEGRTWEWAGPFEAAEACRELPFHRNVFLFFKEALHNVVRHSNAPCVWLGFCVESGALRVTVRDNGKGFDPSADFTGNGIPNMRRRAEELGARLRMESAPGTGTYIELEVPLR